MKTFLFVCALAFTGARLFAADEVPSYLDKVESLQREYDEKMTVIRQQAEMLQRPVNEEYSKQLQKLLRENTNDSYAVPLLHRIEALRSEFEPDTLTALRNSTNEKLHAYLINGAAKVWAEPIYRKLLEEEKNPVTRCKLMSNLVAIHNERFRDLQRNTDIKNEDLEAMIAESQKFLAEVTELRNTTKSEFQNLQTLHEKMEKTLNRVIRLSKLRIGKPAPDIVGQNLEGQPMALSDTRGKVTVVVFWASWCGPCMRMVPHERELCKRMQGKPFAMVGVNRDHELKHAHDAVAKHEMTWPSWQDQGTEDSIAELYAVTSIPQVYVLDPQGVIRYINVRGADLDAAVDALLAETSTK